MPLFPGQQDQDGSVWEPQAADSRLAKTAGADPSGVFTSDLSMRPSSSPPAPRSVGSPPSTSSPKPHPSHVHARPG